ncbi:MAG: DUF131 domain-containing protein [Thaumarchaeota archaeon]|nr:MAG: DUF131 domain-containing protein [Nitrososphaerota archaeon]
MLRSHHAPLTPTVFRRLLAHFDKGANTRPTEVKVLSLRKRLSFVFDLVALGILFVLAGFAVIFVAMILSVSSKPSTESKVRGGGVVMIGPVPLVFGSDMKWASVAIVLALALILVTLVVNLYVI